MRSTLKAAATTVKQIFVSAPNKILLPNTQYARTLHTNLMHAMPIHVDGHRYWTDEELHAATRRGFENAGGKWEEFRKKFTDEDIQAALNKGMELADQYTGAAVRGVWSEAFDKGKARGIQDEQKSSEQRIQSLLAQTAAESKQRGYNEGLEAHPDTQAAMAIGKSEGYRQGILQGTKQTEDKLEKLSHENTLLRETIKTNEAEFLAKKNRIIEQAVLDYKNGQKYYQRLKNVLNDLPQMPIGTNISKWIFQIPLTLRRYAINRSHNLLTNRSYSKRDLEIYGIKIINDRLRIEDIFGPKQLIPQVLKKSKGKYFPGEYNLTDATTFLKHKLYLMPLKVIFLLLVTSMILDELDIYTHGETDEQHLAKKQINKACSALDNLNPRSFATTSFTDTEIEKLNKCKTGCDTAKQFQTQMRIEMSARRQSGYGDSRFFGDVNLPVIYQNAIGKNPQKLLTFNSFQRFFGKPSEKIPLIEKIEEANGSIRARVKSEIYQEKIQELSDSQIQAQRLKK